jgi:Ca2+-dependent lipid-binding protein
MTPEQLNIIARGILQLTGLSPEEIDLQVKQQRQQQKTSQVRQAPSVPTKEQVDKQRVARTRYSGKNNPNRTTKNPKKLLKGSLKEAGITKKGVGRAAGAAGALADLGIRIKNGQDPLTAVIDVGLGTALGIGGGIAGSRLGPGGGVAGNLAGYTVGSNLRSTLFGEESSTSSRGEGSAAFNQTEPAKSQNNAPAVIAPSKQKKQMSNIPVAEQYVNNPNYGKPGDFAAKAAPSQSATQTSRSSAAPTAFVRPDYNSMSELERLKIWAMTNRKMIESVGTRQQLKILQQALGGADQTLRQQGQATYDRGSA